MKPTAFLTLGTCIGALCSNTSAQIHHLSVAESVRQDVPGLEPRLDQVRDQPRAIDKQSFRDPSGDFEPRTVFVRFLPGTAPASRNAAHAYAGIEEVVWQSRLVPDAYLVRIGARDVPGTVNAYLDLGTTLYSEPNYNARRTLDPNDPEFDDLYGMGSGPGSYAQWAWDEWQGSEDFVIAVVDSGILPWHSDLAANLWTNPGETSIANGIDDDGNGYIDDWRGWDFSDMGTCDDGTGEAYPCPGNGPGDNDPTPSCSDHGTHVAGTVGAVGNNGLGVVGMNWRCKIMNLKCENPTGDCDGISNAILAFDYAVANGARVSNHSYGGTSPTQLQYDEILASQAYGHVFVTSAGNEGNDIELQPKYPASWDLSNIITVANTDEDGDIYSGSNYGAVSVDLGAPGTGILSTIFADDYGTKTGTSMAAPHVAGAVALVASKYPHLEWWDLIDRILDSAVPENTLAGKTVTGGRLHAQRALGVWVSPVGGPLKLGTKLNPYSSAFSFLDGFPVAVAFTPEHGTLNMVPGVIVPLASFPPEFGSKPMTLRSSGGPVRLGTL